MNDRLHYIDSVPLQLLSTPLANISYVSLAESQEYYNSGLEVSIE